MQIADEVVPGRMADKFLESSGANCRQGSGEFQMADGVQRVPVQIARLKLLRCPVYIADKVRVQVQKPSKIFQTVGDNT